MSLFFEGKKVLTFLVLRKSPKRNILASLWFPQDVTEIPIKVFHLIFGLVSLVLYLFWGNTTKLIHRYLHLSPFP